MLNVEWLRAYDSLCVIARRNDEAIQTKSNPELMETSKRPASKGVGLLRY